MKNNHIILLKSIFLIAFLIHSTYFFGQPAGFGAAVSSVTSTPTSVIQNNNPTLVGSIKNTSLSSNGYNGEATFDVIAKITYPNLSTVQYVWDNQSFTYNQTKSFTFPSGNFSTATTGIFTVAYTVYTSDRVYSFSTKSTTFTVTAAKPDLIIKQYPTLSSSSVIAGNNITVNYDVVNQGNATAGTSATSFHLSTKNYYDNSATYLTDNSASSLSAGSSKSYSKSITIPASTPAGNYYILVSADGGLAVTESNENNQTTYVALTVTTAKPDLIINQYPTLNSSSVIAGNSVIVNYDVVNQGNATAGTSATSFHLSTKNYYDNSATYLTDNSASSLSAGSSKSYSKSITIPANTSAGNYYILVSADGGGAVTESNESNQSTYVAITVTAPKPDLIIKQYPTLSSSSVIAGNSVIVYYDVINQGNATAGSSSTSLHLSTKNFYDATATYLTDNTASSLSAGNSQSYSKSITIPANTSAGNYYILVSADGGGAVTESNESNQSTYVAITVTAPKPDLIIKQYPTLSSSSVIAGNSVIVYYDVINQGNATAGSSYTSLHLSTKNYYDATATYLTDNTASSLGAGSSQSYSKSVTIPASTLAGNYYILVSADGGLVVTESNENNQTTYVAITVTVAKPDLIIKEYPTLNLSSVIAGGNVTVNYDVINQGNATAGASSTSFHLSTKSYYDATATYLTDYSASSLSAGSSQSYFKSITIPASTPTGYYYLLVSADGGLAVTESNESNQTTYVAITVTVAKPDLIIKEFPNLNASSVIAGNSVTVYYDVINLGNTTAGASTTSFHLSKNSYYDATATYLTDYSASSLSAGSTQSYSKSITIPANTLAGNYYLLVSADGGLAVSESNESNQTTYVAITVTNQNSITQITWSGHKWDVRPAGNGNPGSNNWLNTTENIWVDNAGNLHLKINKIADKWYCSEIYLQQSLGYGEYTFQLSSRIDQLDKNIVLGLFTYKSNGVSATPQENEIDIEFSNWNNTILPNNSQFVFQYRQGGNENNPNLIQPNRFKTNLNGDFSTHKFSWTKGDVFFQSYNGHYSDLPSNDYLINQFKYTDSRIPSESDEKVHINLWLNGATFPSNQQEAEVIIKSFSFKKIDNSISISSANIPTWQREGDDFSGSVTVDLSKAGANSTWHLEADYFNSSGIYQGAIIYPSLSSSTTQNFSTITDTQLRTHSINGNYFTWNVVLESNNNTATATQKTDIIESKWVNKNVMYYNDGTDNQNVLIPINFSTISSANRVEIIRISGASSSSLELTANYSDGTYGGLNNFTIDANGYCRIVNSNSNIGTLPPGLFRYNVYNNTSFKETGNFSITKFGSLGNPVNNDTTIVIIGGNANAIEENIKYLNTHSDPTYDFSIANNFRYGKIGELNANYNTWYIAQPNKDLIENNAYNIGVALNSIMSLTTPKEIHLIAHSLGGVQVRAMLGYFGRKLDGNYEIPNSSLIGKIKTVTFLGTPHRGLIAGTGDVLGINIAGNAGNEMTSGSQFLTDLENAYLPNTIKFLNITGNDPTNLLTDFFGQPSDGVVPVFSSKNPILMKGANSYFYYPSLVQLYVHYDGTNSLLTHSALHHTNIVSNILYSDPNDYPTLNRVFAFIRGKNNFNSSIEDIHTSSSSDKIKISPNPTTGKFEINGMEDLGSKCKVEVFDPTGVAIYVSEIGNFGNKISLDLSNYANGLYIIRLSNNLATYQKRVIKK